LPRLLGSSRGRGEVAEVQVAHRFFRRGLTGLDTALGFLDNLVAQRDLGQLRLVGVFADLLADRLDGELLRGNEVGEDTAGDLEGFDLGRIGGLAPAANAGEGEDIGGVIGRDEIDDVVSGRLAFLGGALGGGLDLLAMLLRTFSARTWFSALASASVIVWPSA